jgi:hypothetical protein
MTDNELKRHRDLAVQKIANSGISASMHPMTEVIMDIDCILGGASSLIPQAAIEDYLYEFLNFC